MEPSHYYSSTPQNTWNFNAKFKNARLTMRKLLRLAIQCNFHLGFRFHSFVQHIICYNMRYTMYSRSAICWESKPLVVKLTDIVPQRFQDICNIIIPSDRTLITFGKVSVQSYRLGTWSRLLRLVHWYFKLDNSHERLLILYIGIFIATSDSLLTPIYFMVYDPPHTITVAWPTTSDFFFFSIVSPLLRNV